jgi:LysM repeat protein
MKRTLIFAALLLTLFFLASYSLTAQASAPYQAPQFSTPTPLPDGRIIYTVKAGDSCFRISAITGVPAAQLRSLNQLGEDCLLVPGQQLLLGIGGPAGATPTAPGVVVTPTVGVPTPTTLPGEAKVCVTLYNDTNGDALRQDAETLIPNGALSVTGTSGQYSQTAVTTTGPDPVCFAKVPEGTYNISVAAPQGFNATTQLNYTIVMKAGDQVFVDFGAQPAVAAQPAEPADIGGSSGSNLLGIVGAGLLLAGIGLGVYAWRFYGRRPMYNK